MWGHMKKDCFELESNAHRRPRGWKSNKSNKTAEAAAEELSMLYYECDEEGEEIPLFCQKCNIDGMSDSEREAMSKQMVWINKHMSEEERTRPRSIYPESPAIK